MQPIPTRTAAPARRHTTPLGKIAMRLGVCPARLDARAQLRGFYGLTELKAAPRIAFWRKFAASRVSLVASRSLDVTII